MAFTDRLHNRGSISTGYDIDNSLKLENDNAEQLYYTPSSAGNLKTWTYSCWFKRTELSYNMMLFGANDTYVYFETDDTLKLRFTGTYVFDTARVFRDTSAWTHIVVAVDTTQATEADRIKIYFNGEDQAGLFANDSFPAQNTNTSWNNTLVHYVAGWATSSFNPSCYLAEVYNIDGQKLEATDFGEFDEDTGIWKPKAYTGSYGTNGYHLDFENASDLGTVAAGTQHSFVKSNITSVDQATDTPTNNFVTWNVIGDTRLSNDSDRIYFNEGGTQPNKSTGTGWTTVVSTQAFSSGKWYWEGEVERQDGTTMWGCFPTKSREVNVYLNSYIGGSEPTPIDSGCAFYDNDDAYYHDNTATSCTISGGTVQTVAGDIIMIAVDMDNNKFYAGRNGQWFNSTDNTHANATGITLSDEEHFFAFAAYHPNRTYKTNLGGYTTISISSAASDANGYGNFEYAPPTGYYALCSKNLAEYGG